MARPKEFVDKPCDLCRSRDKVRMIRPRRGMYRSASYGAPKPWCLKCCKQHNGLYCLD